MSERSRFFNRRSTDLQGDYTYSADDFAEFLNTFFSDGVVGSASLKVSATNNRIIIKSGYAIIKGHWYNNDSNIRLTNPTVSTTKRKDSIVLKFDNEERSIKAVWLTGSQETYPVLSNNNDVQYLLLANIELLAGGTVKSITDKRVYSQALYTLSLQEFEDKFSQFIKNCNDTVNKTVKNATVNSEIILSRGGLATLNNRLTVTDNKHLDITQAGTDNLFDYTQAQTGWLDHSGSIEVTTESRQYYTTDYIPIESGMQMFAYDNNGNAVNFETLEFYHTRFATGLMKCVYTQSNTWINDCGADYVRLDFKTSDIAPRNLMITFSDIPPVTYIPYKQIIKPSSIIRTSYGMDYITETVNIGTNMEYKLTANDIAPSSPVDIHIGNRTSSEDTIIRTDGEDLVDILTGNTVNSTMTDIQITTEDILAGIKSTGTMSIVVKYYNKNCENLLQMIGNGTDGYRIKFISVDTDIYTTENE